MKVGDEFRTNPLSSKPGGSTVRVFFHNGSHRDYDKVKHPESFINKILEIASDVKSAEVL
jgi:hypothetical protein